MTKIIKIFLPAGSTMIFSSNKSDASSYFDTAFTYFTKGPPDLAAIL